MAVSWNIVNFFMILNVSGHLYINKTLETKKERIKKNMKKKEL